MFEIFKVHIFATRGQKVVLKEGPLAPSSGSTSLTSEWFWYLKDVDS